MREKKTFNIIDVLIIVCVALLVLATVFRAQVISFFSDRENLSEFVVSFRSEPLENSYVGYVKAGRNIEWVENKLEIGEIRAVTQSYPAKVYTVGTDGTLIITEDDSTSVLEGTLLVRAAAKDGCFISGTEFIGAGTKMTLRTQNVLFEVTVLAVTREE
ncbi:MAG: DUF4330 family protein [Clostridia bacterium]|nr:DUF4330 family protein [Clostridia bacterium]